MLGSHRPHGINEAQHRNQRDSPKEAANDMFEETDSLLLDKLIHHVAEDSAYSVEALVGLANVCEACIIEQDFLDDKNCNGFAEL